MKTALRIVVGIAPLLVGLLCVLAPSSASALDPNRALSQLKHTSWSADRGAPSNIKAITQGPDGYLWIGAAGGLYRFDGVTFEQIPPAAGDRDHSGQIRSLLMTRSGELFVGYAYGGVSILRDGQLQPTDLPQPHDRAAQMVEDSRGAVWLASGRINRPLSKYANGRWETVGDDWGLQNGFVYSIVVGRNGVLWVANESTIQFLRPNARHFEQTGEQTTMGSALFLDRSGSLWVSDNYGVRRLPNFLNGAHTDAPMTKPPAIRPQFSFAFVDHDGVAWVADGSHGVFRFRPESQVSAVVAPPPESESFRRQDGLTSDTVDSFAEDKEGDIWLGTNGGLDQFRLENIVPIIEPHPRPGELFTTAVDTQGVVYVADSDDLFQIRPGSSPERILPEITDIEWICKGFHGGLWTVTASEVLSLQDGKASRFPFTGDKSSDVHGCGEDRFGGFWVAEEPAGLQLLRNGSWSRVSLPALDTAHWTLRLAEPDLEGHIITYVRWRSLIDVSEVPFRTVATADELPIGKINNLALTQNDFFVGGDYGLAEIDGKAIRILKADQYPWLKGTYGIAASDQGDTWTIGALGIAQIPTERLRAAFRSPDTPLLPAIFDQADGLPNPIGTWGSDHAVVVGGDGRIWFEAGEKVVWIDPAHLYRNRVLPPVVIKSVTVDGKRYSNLSRLTLPEGAFNLEIDYTALSLSIPERVRFRYRLAGFDRDWVDAGQRRQAFYSNLPAGNYHFQVIAANNDGAWNYDGASLKFRIPPTFFQSWWFDGLCLLGFAGLLWLGYALRLRQVTTSIRIRLEARLAERERIARELHDTLLQGFQGLVLGFQSIVERLAPDNTTRQLMEQALLSADHVMVEGRERVKDLRSPERSEDLHGSLRTAAERRLLGSSTDFQIVSEGTLRKLHPLVHGELLSIGEEAITNTARHAQATNLTIKINYHARGLRLTFRDDGIGIAPDTIRTAPFRGHFGLMGLHERADRIRGKLVVLSKPDDGTEILVTVPAGSAYASPAKRHRLLLLNRPADEEIWKDV